MNDKDKEIQKLESKSFLPSWVRKDKIQKIQMLEIFPQVHEWILAGIPNSEIARRIQEHGCMVDDELETIIGCLGHYRVTVPPAAILARQRPQDVAKAYKRMVPMRSYIEHLDDMINGQLEQVQKAKRMAEGFEAPMTGYGEEIERYIKILQNVYRLRKEAGLTDKEVEQYVAQDPWAFDLDKAYGREGLNERMKDPKSRVKILGTIERLFDLVKQKQDKGEEFAFEQVIDVKNDAPAERTDVQPAAPTSKDVDGSAPLEVVQQIDLSTLGPDDFKG